MAADRWSQAFFDRLLGTDSVAVATPSLIALADALANLLSQFDGRPAIFTSWPAPGNNLDLYVAMSGNSVASANDTKTTRGRIVGRYIHVFGKATGSQAAVENAAELVRALFHRQALPVDGHRVYITTAEGPVDAPTGEDMYGRVVIVTLSTEEV